MHNLLIYDETSQDFAHIIVFYDFPSRIFSRLLWWMFSEDSFLLPKRTRTTLLFFYSFSVLYFFLLFFLLLNNQKVLLLFCLSFFLVCESSMPSNSPPMHELHGIGVDELSIKSRRHLNVSPFWLSRSRSIKNESTTTMTIPDFTFVFMPNIEW